MALLSPRAAQAGVNGYLVCGSPTPSGSNSDVSFTCTPPQEMQLRLIAYYTPPSTSGFTTAAQVKVDGDTVIPASVFATGTSGTTVVSFEGARTIAITDTTAGESLTIEVVDDNQACGGGPFPLDYPNSPTGGEFDNTGFSGNPNAIPQFQLFNGDPGETPSTSAEVTFNGSALVSSGTLSVSQAGVFPYLTLLPENVIEVGFTNSSESGLVYVAIVDRDVTPPQLSVDSLPTWVGPSASLTAVGTVDDPSAQIVVGENMWGADLDGTFTFPLGSVSDGDNEFVITAYDVCTNSSSPITLHTKGDMHSPTLTLASPTGSVNEWGERIVHESPTTITVHFEDLQSDDSPGSGVDPDSITLEYLGDSYTPTIDLEEHTASWSVELWPDSATAFQVHATDLVGNQAWLNFILRLQAPDETAPNVSFLTPWNGMTVNHSTLGIDLGYWDPGPGGSGINASAVHVYLSSSATDLSEAIEISGLNVSMSETTGVLSFGLPEDVPNGTWYLVARVEDNDGNIGTGSAQFSLQRTGSGLSDTTAPTIAFVTPIDEATVTYSSLAANATYSDSGTNVSGVQSTTVHFYLSTSPTNLSSAFRIWDVSHYDSEAWARIDLDTFPTSFANGTYYLVATVQDTAGNLGTTSVEFELDRDSPSLADSTQPTLSFVSPTANATVTTDTLSFEFSYADSGTGASGIVPATIRLYLSSNASALWGAVPVTPTLASGTATGTVSFNSPQMIENGTHYLVAKAQDLAGNTRLASVAFDLERTSEPPPEDTTPPTVGFVSPEEETVVTSSSVEVIFQYADTGSNASGIDLDSVHLYLTSTPETMEGALLISDLTVGASEASGTVPFDELLENGTYYLIASVEDVAGHSQTAMISVELDRPGEMADVAFTAPSLRIEDNLYVTGLTQTISFDFSGSVPLTPSLTIDGTAVELCETPAPEIPEGCLLVDEGQATTVWTFADATPHTLVATGTSTEITASDTVTLIIDQSPPVVAFTSPEPNDSTGYLTRVAQQHVTFAYSSGIPVQPSGVTLSVDGTAVPACNGSNTYCLTAGSSSATAYLNLAPNEIHSLQASVTDVAGMTGTETFAIAVDSQWPTFTFSCTATGCPNLGWATNHSSFLLTVTHADAVPESGGTFASGVSNVVAVLDPSVDDGDSLTTSSASNPAVSTVAVTGLTEGSHQVRVIVFDQAGNSNQSDYSFHVNTETLVVSSLSPGGTVSAPEAYSTPEQTVTVEYLDTSTDWDSPLLSVKDNGTEISSALTEQSGGGAGQTIEKSGTHEFSEGLHVLTARITNASGSASETISKSFWIDTAAPTGSITSFTRQTDGTYSLVDACADSGSGLALASVLPKRITSSGTLDGDIETLTIADGTCQIDDLELADGEYNLDVRLVDHAGNEHHLTHHVYAESSGPTLSLTAPQPPTSGVGIDPLGHIVVSAYTITLSYGFSQSVAPIDPESFRLTLDGHPTCTTTYPGACLMADSSGATGSYTSITGSHTFHAEVTDAAGRTATLDKTIVFDLEPPTVAVSFPGLLPANDGTSYVSTDGEFEVDVTATDAMSALSDPPTLQDSAGHTYALAQTGTSTWSASADLPDGIYEFTASAPSYSGLTGMVTRTVRVQSSAPTLSITWTGGSNIFTNDSAHFSVHYSDLYTSIVSLSGYIDEAPVTLGTNVFFREPYGATSTNGFVGYAANGQIHTLTVILEDETGHTSEVTEEFIEQRPAPHVAITAPTVGATANQASYLHVPLTFTYGDPGSSISGANVLVAVNGGNQTTAFASTVTGGVLPGVGPRESVTVSGTVPVPNVTGNATILVQVTDVAGLSANTSVVVAVNVDSPALTNVVPINGFATNEATLTVSGTVTNPLATTVTVSVVRADSTTGSATAYADTPATGGSNFSSDVTLTEGLNTVTLLAHDASGNADTVLTRTVALDTTAPALTIASPLAGSMTLPCGGIDVTGTVSDVTATTVTVNGKPAPITDGTYRTRIFLVGGTPGQVEAEEISVTAIDAAGNETTVTRTVNVAYGESGHCDNVPPIVAMELGYPWDQLLTYPGGSVHVRYVVADPDDASGPTQLVVGTPPNAAGIASVKLYCGGHLVATTTSSAEIVFSAPFPYSGGTVNPNCPGMYQDEHGTWTLPLHLVAFDTEGNSSDDVYSGTTTSTTVKLMTTVLVGTLADPLHTEGVPSYEDKDAYVLPGTEVTINGAHHFRNLLVSSGATITHDRQGTTPYRGVGFLSCPGCTDASYDFPWTSMTLMVDGTIEVDGLIKADGKGFAGGRSGPNTAHDTGLMYDPVYTASFPGAEFDVASYVGVPASSLHTGGSHGGIGGYEKSAGTDLQTVAYDDFRHPRIPGSGGGDACYDASSDGVRHQRCGLNARGGDGGGVILIRGGADSILQVRGTITANGTSESVYGGSGQYRHTMGGAGGAIDIDVRTIVLGGDIRAAGGYGGGGGRVAVRYREAGINANVEDPSYGAFGKSFAHIEAPGHTWLADESSENWVGGAGTVFLQNVGALRSDPLTGASILSSGSPVPTTDGLASDRGRLIIEQANANGFPRDGQYFTGSEYDSSSPPAFPTPIWPSSALGDIDNVLSFEGLTDAKKLYLRTLMVIGGASINVPSDLEVDNLELGSGARFEGEVLAHNAQKHGLFETVAWINRPYKDDPAFSYYPPESVLPTDFLGPVIFDKLDTLAIGGRVTFHSTLKLGATNTTHRIVAVGHGTSITLPAGEYLNFVLPYDEAVIPPTLTGTRPTLYLSAGGQAFAAEEAVGTPTTEIIR